MPGTPIAVAAGSAGLVLRAPCGGKGTCGKCRIKLVSGLIKGTPLDDGSYLACQSFAQENATVDVPEESRYYSQKIMVRGLQRHIQVKPNIRKTHIELKKPSLKDQTCDADRITYSIAAKVPTACIPTEILNSIPDIVRNADYDVTVVTDGNKVIAVEPGDTHNESYGVAVDIGTTTVAGMLLSIKSGTVLKSVSRTNPQSEFGEDVISRIDYANKHNGQKELQQKIIGCLNEIIDELCQKTDIQPENIYEVTICGNTIMTHLLLCVSPQYIAQAPYIPVFRKATDTLLSKAGLHGNPNGNLHTLPNIAGYVGGDIVAGIISTGLHETEKIRVMIDIGTNGEIVIGNKHRILSCATAAGPAFEGARISRGMRGSPGAIDKVVIDQDVQVNVINDVPPMGICGSGLIDAVAEMLDAGVIDETGRIVEPEEYTGGLDSIRQRIVPGDAGFDFVLYADKKKEIRLTQKDIREIQLGKSAIRAGIEILIDEYGIQTSDVDEILLAGAFGNFIRRSKAKRMGLLPDIPTEKIIYVGNTASEGAIRTLLACGCRESAEAVSRKVEYIELSGRNDFQNKYVEYMMF